LNANDPFFKIASDPIKLKLTRLLVAGKPTKLIAQILNSPETDIEKNRKKILLRNISEKPRIRK